MDTFESIRTIPGYKIILKAVLRFQIQQLINQLSSETDEETLLLSMNSSDLVINDMGTETAKSFLQDHKDIKSKFFQSCMKSQQSKKKEETEKNEQTAASKDVIESGNIPGSQPITIIQLHPALERKSPKLRYQPYIKKKPDKNDEHKALDRLEMEKASTVEMANATNELRTIKAIITEATKEPTPVTEMKNTESVQLHQSAAKVNETTGDAEVTGDTNKKDEGAVKLLQVVPAISEDKVKKTTDPAAKCNKIKDSRKHDSPAALKKVKGSRSKGIRLSITHDNKLKILDRARQIGRTRACKEYGIAESTLRGWLRDEAKIRAVSKSVTVDKKEEHKPLSCALDLMLEKAVYCWYTDAKERQDCVSVATDGLETVKIIREINPETVFVLEVYPKERGNSPNFIKK